MNKNEKIVKIAELNLRITEIDYEIALITATLKDGSIKELKEEKTILTSKMFKLAREVENE